MNIKTFDKSAVQILGLQRRFWTTRSKSVLQNFWRSFLGMSSRISVIRLKHVTAYRPKVKESKFTNHHRKQRLLNKIQTSNDDPLSRRRLISSDHNDAEDIDASFKENGDFWDVEWVGKPVYAEQRLDFNSRGESKICATDSGDTEFFRTLNFGGVIKEVISRTSVKYHEM